MGTYDPHIWNLGRRMVRLMFSRIEYLPRRCHDSRDVHHMLRGLKLAERYGYFDGNSN